MSHRSRVFGKGGARRTWEQNYAWPLRGFIAVSVACIIGRSALNIGIRHTQWREELLMYTVPRALPAREERAELRAGRSSGSPLADRLAETGGSVLRFLSPWPNPRTRPLLTDGQQWLKFIAVWLHTRTEFLGRLVGVDERWTMFSPSVGTSRRVARAVLHYADGSRREVRALTEPRDLTSFFRPFAQRRLQHDVNLTRLEAVRLGWARWLARSHAKNAMGSALAGITLHSVKHALAPPHVDARAFWQGENSAQLSTPPFWRFDPVSGMGSAVEETAPAEPCCDDLE